MPWWKKSDGSLTDKKEEAGVGEEFKPDDMKKEITESLSGEMKKFGEAQDKRLKPIEELAAAIKAEREDQKKKEEAAKKKTEDENKVTFEEQFLIDPEGAINSKLTGVTQATMILAAREAKRETLGEKEYYHGEFKTRVDELINSMPLKDQCNTTAIENCYKIAFAEKHQEITDGKIKSRFSDMNMGNNGTGGHSGSSKGSENTDTLTAEEKSAAKALGFTEKEYADSKKDMVFV